MISQLDYLDIGAVYQFSRAGLALISGNLAALQAKAIREMFAMAGLTHLADQEALAGSADCTEKSGMLP